MMDAIGVAQHHDAITGTAKQAVSNDYSSMLHKALKSNEITYAKVLKERLGIEHDLL